MKRNLSKKSLYASMALVAGMGLSPVGAHAASYYYSLFEITGINLEAQYWVDAGHTTAVWARPDSNTNAQRSAKFTGNTSASNSVGGSDADQASAFITSHAPAPGTFPIDAPQAYVGAAPAENTFSQQGVGGALGQFARADSIIENIGINANPFGIPQSAGENSRLVVEGYSDSTINYSSDADNHFSGYIDLSTTGLDFGVCDAAPFAGCQALVASSIGNFGWTGYIRLSFDYHYKLELSSDMNDPGAGASRSVEFTLKRDTLTGTGNPPHTPVVAQLKGGLGDFNCDVNGDDVYGEECGSELSQSIDVTMGDDYSEESAAGAGFMQVFDLRSQLTAGRFFYELAFDQVVNGRAEASIPEPSVLALLGLGVFGLGMARRNRRAS